MRNGYREITTANWGLALTSQQMSGLTRAFTSGTHKVVEGGSLYLSDILPQWIATGMHVCKMP